MINLSILLSFDWRWIKTHATGRYWRSTGFTMVTVEGTRLTIGDSADRLTELDPITTTGHKAGRKAADAILADYGYVRISKWSNSRDHGPPEMSFAFVIHSS